MYYLESEHSLLHGYLARNPQELFSKMCAGYICRTGNRNDSWKLLGAAEGSELSDIGFELTDPLYNEMHQWASNLSQENI